MTPTKEYTGRAHIRMYNKDCMDFLHGCGENEYDLAIVDPPYGIGESAKQRSAGRKNDKRWSNRSENWRDYDKKDWDGSIPEHSYFYELFRVSKNQIIFGWNYYYKHLYKFPSVIVWDKKNGSNHFSDFETAWCSFYKGNKMFRWMWSGFRKERPERRIHPTQKPVALYKWLLQNYANEGDKIIDTHGGSMSIAIACWDMGFDLDIVELDKDYFKDAVKRFETHISQLQLF